MFIYLLNKPNSIKAWENILDCHICELSWHEICINLNNPLQVNKISDFNWKCVHRSIYSELRLEKMRRSNGICKLCNVKTESLCHLLYFCDHVYPIWNATENKLHEMFNINVNINEKMVIFGTTPDKYNENVYIYNIINCFISEVKWQIWKNRNNVKYGKKEPTNSEVIFTKSVHQFKNNLVMLKNKRHNKLDQKTSFMIELCIEKC